jgi:glyoxylase-like metal-dependent hydrolase (beta-lactamase superfamily II)
VRAIHAVSVRRVHHLNCGTMRPPVPIALGQPGWRGRGVMVCHCILIETERDGLILIDAGFSTRDVADPMRIPTAFRRGLALYLDAAETAHRQIVRLGFDPRDVRHIVLTHMDLDHAGGLVDFPDATVHVHERELRAATERSTYFERHRYVPAQWAHGPRWQTHAERGDTWRDLPAVARLPGLDADVGLVPLHGHSRGHAAVIVRAGDRWVVHAGDAYFHPRSLEPGGTAPFGLRAFENVAQFDRATRLASVDALRRLRRDADVDINCAHEPGELAAAQARATPGGTRSRPT